MKLLAVIFLLLFCFAMILQAQLREKKSLIKDRVSGYQITPNKKVKNSEIQSGNKLSSTEKSIGIKAEAKNTFDSAYYTDRIYVKFKSHNINPNIINPENFKLYTHTFNNPVYDAIAQKYGIERIEEAFKVNSQKYYQYLNNPEISDSKTNNLKNIFQLYFDSKTNIDKLISEFELLEDVEYAERVPIHRNYAVPNDTRLNEQFYFDQIKAKDAWDIHKGQDGTQTVIVGIIDSGTDWTHPDLVGNIYQNLGEDADSDGRTIENIGGQWVLDPGDLNGVDNDGNGYIDDLIGWNYITDDGTAANNPKVTDNNKHGTHVAGIAAASTNNATGVASISWNVKFIPTKNSSNNDGQSINYGYDAMIYLSEFGVDVINCSWGGYGFSNALQEVVDYATGLGALIVVSAGNNGNDIKTYPACYQGILSVGSVAKTDVRAYYSSYGRWVDIAAPGGDWFLDSRILSTTPDNNYEVMQGTSMASPLVAGLAGLIKSYNPSLSSNQIVELLIANSDDISNELDNYAGKLGYGRINAYKALANPNAKMNKKLKLLPYSTVFNPNKENYQPGETVEILYTIENYNPLYGASNVNYSINLLDANLTLIQGGGSFSFPADSRKQLNTIKVKVKDLDKPFSKAAFEIIFVSDSGIDGDSIFVIELNLINTTLMPKVFAYNSFSTNNDPLSPVSFKIHDATQMGFLTGNRDPLWVRGGTWYEGKWYCIETDGSGNDALVTYDTTNGQRTIIKNLDNSLNGLAFDPETNLIWGVGGNSNENFYVINPKTGYIKMVLNNNNGIILINLACNKDGELMSVDLNDDQLLYYDKWTGDIFWIADLVEDHNYAQSMDYDFINEMMYSTSYFYDNDGWEISQVRYFDFDNFTMNKLSDVRNNNELTGLAIPHNFKPNKVDLKLPEFADGVREIVFEWESYPNALSYQLYFSTDPMFVDYDMYEVNNTSYIYNEPINFGRYYWMVKAVLGNGNEEWSGVWMFDYIDFYCIPYTEECDEYISRFEFSNITNITGCGLVAGHSNYTNLTATVEKGKTYNVKVINPVSYDEDICGIWIDYNQNGDFEIFEFVELISTDGKKTFQKQITIPMSAKTGTTRLRVRIVYDEVLDPCANADWGESEDYSVHIISLPVVEIKNIDKVKSSSAEAIGIVISDGGLEVTARGVCWSTEQNPTITNSKTSNGTGIGQYISNITGLNPDTKYYVRAYATNSIGTSYGNEFSFTTKDGTGQDISLVQGWNIISSYMEPNNTSIPVIWDAIKSNVVIVKNNMGLSYIPAFDIDGIINWNSKEGYQVYMLDDELLSIEGTVIEPENTPISLGSGWHIVSYLRKGLMDAETAFETITNDDALVIAKNNEGQSYIPMFGINDIHNLIPGQGYQLYLVKNSTLTYPENDFGKRTLTERDIRPNPSVLIPEYSRTGNNSILLVFSEFPDGNEIGVYTQEDKLIGSGVIQNGKVAVTVWADNEQTSIKEGASKNERLRIRHYDIKSGRISDVKLNDISDGITGAIYSELIYKDNAFIVGKVVTENSNNDNYLLKVNPNPFSDEIAIEFVLKNTEEVSLKMYNLQGILIKTLAEGRLAGVQKFSISGSDIPNAEYTIILTIGKEKYIRKVLKIK